MNIRLTENYELHRMDSLNWRMFEHKLVEKKDGAASGRKYELCEECAYKAKSVLSAFVMTKEGGDD